MPDQPEPPRNDTPVTQFPPEPPRIDDDKLTVDVHTK